MVGSAVSPAAGPLRTVVPYFRQKVSHLAKAQVSSGLLRELPESNVVESSLREVTERSRPGTVQFGSGPSRAREDRQPVHGPTTKGIAMKITHNENDGIEEILKRREAELALVLRKRDGIAIEKSADQMDEIQYSSERDLAISNVDRETVLLREVRAALRRIHEGSFGTCLECETAISPKRLAAVPWARLCIKCQEAADRDRQEGSDLLSDSLFKAA
jgi:DnaK suppressor protein